MMPPAAYSAAVVVPGCTPAALSAPAGRDLACPDRQHQHVTGAIAVVGAVFDAGVLDDHPRQAQEPMEFWNLVFVQYEITNVVSKEAVTIVGGCRSSPGAPRRSRPPWT